MKTKLLLLLMVTTLYAKEADYVKKHCKGKIEHVLKDRTRIDCLTANYAIEYDFAKKWAEAIGQSLYYAKIVLIVGPNDKRYIKRLNKAIEGLDIKVEILNK